MDRISNAHAAAVTAAAVACTYSVVGTGDWEWHMHWDDRENFVANPMVQRLGGSLSDLATPVLGVFEPVSVLVKKLEYQLFGFNIQAYLAGNLHSPIPPNICLTCVLRSERGTALRQLHAVVYADEGIIAAAFRKLNRCCDCVSRRNAIFCCPSASRCVLIICVKILIIVLQWKQLHGCLASRTCSQLSLP
jgi:hypothetical protein